MRTHSLKKIIFILSISSLLVLQFQNCGDISIKDAEIPQQVETGLGIVEAKICPSLSSAGQNVMYRVSPVYVLNLTTSHHQGQLLVDSDADGIPDAIEENLNLSATNRRTRGLLDSVCLKTGVCSVPVGCNNQSVSPGLTDCDLSPFRATGSSIGVTGLDSDRDSIPDLIELLRGTNLVVSDAELNMVKIIRGHDVNSPNEIPYSERLIYSVEPTNETCNGMQSVQKIKINQLPLVKTLAVTDPQIYQSPSGQSIDFSHREGENLIAFIYIAEPQIGTAPKELYFQMLKIHHEESQGDYILQADDFIFLGEIQP